MSWMPCSRLLASIAVLVAVGSASKPLAKRSAREVDQGKASLLRRAGEEAKEHHLSDVQMHSQAGTDWENTIHVWCGGHAASECDVCTQNLGKDWCNGDCEWNQGECLFRSTRVWCGNRAVDECSQCMDQLTHAPGGVWCDGDCAYRDTNDGMACVRKRGEEEMVPEVSKMPEKLDKPLSEEIKKPSVLPGETFIAKGLPPGYAPPGQHTGGLWKHFMPGGPQAGSIGGGDSTTAAPGGRNGADALRTRPAQAQKPDIVTEAAHDDADNFPMLTGTAKQRALALKLRAMGHEPEDAGAGAGAGTPMGANPKKPCDKNTSAALVKKLVDSDAIANPLPVPMSTQSVDMNVQKGPAQKASTAPAAKTSADADERAEAAPETADADAGDGGGSQRISKASSDGPSDASAYTNSILTPPIVKAVVAASGS